MRVPSGLKADDVFEVILDLRPYSVICPVETEGGDFIAVMAPPPTPAPIPVAAPALALTMTNTATSSPSSTRTANSACSATCTRSIASTVVLAPTISSTATISSAWSNTTCATCDSAASTCTTNASCTSPSGTERSSTDVPTPSVAPSPLLIPHSRPLCTSFYIPSSSAPNVGGDEIDINCGDGARPEALQDISYTGADADADAGIVQEMHLNTLTPGTPTPHPPVSTSLTPPAPTVSHSKSDSLDDVNLNENTVKCAMQMHTRSDTHSDTDIDADIGGGGGSVGVHCLSAANQTIAALFINETSRDIAASDDSGHGSDDACDRCDLNSDNKREKKNSKDVTEDISAHSTMTSHFTEIESSVTEVLSKQPTDADIGQHVEVTVSEEKETAEDIVLVAESILSANRSLPATCTPPLDDMTTLGEQDRNQNCLIPDPDPHTECPRDKGDLKYEKSAGYLKCEKEEGDLKSRGCDMETERIDMDMSMTAPCKGSLASLRSASSTKTETITCPLCTFENDGEVESECVAEGKGEHFSSGVKSIGRKTVTVTFCRVCSQDLRSDASSPPIAVPIPLATPSLTVISSLRSDPTSHILHVASIEPSSHVSY